MNWEVRLGRYTENVLTYLLCYSIWENKMTEVINPFKALDFTTNRKFYLIGESFD